MSGGGLNLSDAGVVGALGFSAVALIRGLLQSGRDQTQEVDILKGEVAALKRRADDMQTAIQQVQRDVAVLPAMNAKLDGLDRLVTFRLDEMSSQLRLVAERLNAPVTLPAASVRRGTHGQPPPAQR